jgi:hypothetical protein
MNTIEAMRFIGSVSEKARVRSEFGYFLPAKYGGYTVVERPDLAHVYGKMMYEFTLNQADPLTWRAPDGTFYQPDRHFLSDQGSIPRPIQRWIPKDQFPRSFYMHDSMCEHEGAYGSATADGEFLFTRMSREAVDAALRSMVRAEGGSWRRACTIWFGVRIGVKLGFARDWKQDDGPEGPALGHNQPLVGDLPAGR